METKVEVVENDLGFAMRKGKASLEEKRVFPKWPVVKRQIQRMGQFQVRAGVVGWVPLASATRSSISPSFPYEDEFVRLGEDIGSRFEPLGISMEALKAARIRTEEGSPEGSTRKSFVMAWNVVDLRGVEYWSCTTITDNDTPSFVMIPDGPGLRMINTSAVETELDGRLVGASGLRPTNTLLNVTDASLEMMFLLVRGASPAPCFVVDVFGDMVPFDALTLHADTSGIRGMETLGQEEKCQLELSPVKNGTITHTIQ